jgi:hypothetical protein
MMSQFLQKSVDKTGYWPARNFTLLILAFAFCLALMSLIKTGDYGRFFALPATSK